VKETVNMKKIMTIVAMLAVFGSAGLANAGDEIVFSAEDVSPAIRVFNGFPYKISVTSTGNFEITDAGIQIAVYDTATTAITNTFTNGIVENTTVALLGASIAGTTNSAGKKLLTIDPNCALAADLVCTNLLAVSAGTIMPGEWGTLLAWDTSKVKHFDVYMPSSEYGGSANDKTIESIYGYAGGTGDITINGYIQDALSGTMTLKYQKLIVSPQYVLAAHNGITNATASDAVGPANFAFTDWPAPVHKSQGVLVRASHATTATTGGIGITTKNK
jgi:hypothetical protein